MGNKKEQQLKDEILAREETGKFNSLEKPASAFPDTFTLGENPLQNIPAILDKVIVDSKKQNSNQRESVVVDNRKPDYYEAFKVYLNDRDSRDLKTIKQNDDVVLTRCAESTEKTAKSPFYFDKNASGKEAARRAFSLHLHPRSTISKTSEIDEIPAPGAIIEQGYLDKERIQIVINRVAKKGLNIGKDFKIGDEDENPQTSEFHTNPTPFAPPDGTSTLPFAPSPESETAIPDSNPDGESTDQTPAQKTWNPKFSPLAAGATIYKKVRVSSRFGMRLSPITKTMQGHSGVDLVSAPLMPIVAIQDGKVSFVRTASEEVQSRYLDKYGNGTSAGAMVSIKHKTNDSNVKYYSQYMHMVKVTVKIGETVKAGDIIGFMGGGSYGYISPSPVAKDKKNSKMHANWPGSGNSTGAHLHFAIKKKVGGEMTYVDPLSFKYPQQVVLPDDKIKSFLKENRKIVESQKEALILLHRTKNPNQEFITKDKK